MLQCKLNWGDSDEAIITGVLAENLGSKARVDVKLKVSAPTTSCCICCRNVDASGDRWTASSLGVSAAMFVGMYPLLT